jgi:predicted DCC family thiol-disulfide oxidoreductase YuxK
LSPRSSQEAARLWLVFDGTCGFCTRSARWVQARDRAGRIALIHAQAPGQRDRFGLSPAETDRAAWAFDRIGRRWEGAAAMNRALRQLDGPWGLLGALYAVPPVRWVEDRVYRWVARNRPLLSRLWGVTPPCDEPGARCV